MFGTIPSGDGGKAFDSGTLQESASLAQGRGKGGSALEHRGRKTPAAGSEQEELVCLGSFLCRYGWGYKRSFPRIAGAKEEWFVTETEATSYGAGVEEVHILWISEGMSCDGDTISVTAATLPSLEDVLLGNIPGLPQVHLHNKVLDPSLGGADYLGWDFRSVAGIPIVNVPGCPVQPDNFMETLTWLLYQAGGMSPMIPLDDQLRPTWLFGKTVHEGCDRAAYYEQGDFALDYNSPKCQVKIGCWGPVVNCNVPKRGWMDGVGGCPNVGGICIGCTMPGFPDKFMPFMDEPPGGTLSTTLTKAYGTMIRKLRTITNETVNKEPKWRHNKQELTTGYNPRWPN